MTRLSLSNFVICGIWLCGPGFLTADLVVSPVSSEVYAGASIEQVVNQQTDSQATPILPLSASAANSGDETSITVDASMEWFGAGQLNMNIDQWRGSTGPNTSFGLEGRTRYDFFVSEDTTLSIDYSFVFTTSANWWSHFGFVNLDGSTIVSAAPGTPIGSPAIYSGVLDLFLPAGNHWIEAQFGGAATGDFAGTRTLDADLAIQIGPATIPEPGATGLLMFSAILLARRRRRLAPR